MCATINMKKEHKMSMLMEKGIIFDETFAEGLLGACLDSVPWPQADDHVELENQRFLTEKWKCSKVKKKSLEMLLLYEKVYLYGHDRQDLPDISKLEREGLVEVIKNWDNYRNNQFQSLPRKAKKAMVNTLSTLFEERIKGLERDRFGGINDENIFQTFIKHIDFIKSTCLFMRPFLRQTRSIEYAHYFKSMEEVDFILDLILERDEGRFYKDFIFRRARGREFRTSCSLALVAVWEATVRLRGLIEISSKKNLPVLTSMVKVGSRKAMELPISPVKAEYQQAFQIFMDEVSVVPNIDSLDNVLRLRDDKRIRNFREVLQVWAAELKTGQVSAEQKIRREIQKANQELKRLKNWREIGGWITYLSLPISVASLLSGIPAGLGLTPLGLATRIGADLLEKKYKWMLVGR